MLASLLLAALLGLSAAQCNLQSVCYALDESGSISRTDFQQQKDFTLATANILAGLNPNTGFSAVGFNSNARSIQGTTPSLSAFTAAIGGAVQRTGGTNIFAGLQSCLDTLRLQPPGARLIILVTDGQGSSGADPRPAIVAENIAVLAVGVGSGINTQFLEATASSPEFFVPTTFSDLPSLGQRIATAACDLIDMLMPSPSPEVTPFVSESPVVDGPTVTPTVSASASATATATASASPSASSTASASPAANTCASAFAACDWTFAGTGGLSTFSISGLPNTPFSPAIVAKGAGPALGVLNGNIVPEFIDDAGVAAKITQFGAQPFAPSAFKPVTNGTVSFMARETFQGDQALVAVPRCVRVFFSSFQILGPNATVIGSVNNVPKSQNKCVVFRTSF